MLNASAIRLTYDLMLRVFLFAALSCWVCCQTSAGREPEVAQTIQELVIGIQNKAPSTYFALATELFRSGRKDDAAFWYYVGQLRYRFLVLAKAKASEPSDEQAHFWLLSESVGQSIYERADQRSATLIRALDRALVWDLEQPNGYTSKSTFSAEHERARQEMLALRERIKTDPSGLKRPLPAGRGLISW
ncbi:MAG TPA: hypothetical protein VHS80_11730 [Chthoniobacterales bacterium]|nr:hypothetical protein [Chthoniobacterales bacterium]